MLFVRHVKPPLHVAMLLFVAAVCAAVIGLDALHIWTARGARLEQARIETANLSRSLAQHAQDVFESTDATIKGFRATLIAEGRTPVVMETLARRMRTRVVNQPIIQRLFIYDENGRWVASSLEGSAFEAIRNLTYTDRDYFQYHRDHAEDVVLIGRPIQTKLNGAWVITVTRRLNHADGSFAGVVGASIPLDLFQHFFDTFDVGRKGAISLASTTGIVFVRRPYVDGNTGRSIADSEFFRAIRPRAESGSFEYVSFLDGTSRLGSFRRVSGFDLILIVGRDKSEVLRPWWRDAQAHIALTAVIVLVVGGIGYQITLETRRRAAAEAQLALYQQALERRVVERTADLQDMVSQRDLLLQEVYHRVNNNMQAVDALLAIEEGHLRDPEARRAFASMRTRVYTFGLAHQQLMAAPDLKTFNVAPFLQGLVHRVAEHDPGNRVALTVETVTLMTTLDFAIPLGLVMSEIVTACLDQEFRIGAGRLAVKLERNATQDAVLTVSATGTVPAAHAIREPNAATRSRRLIEGLVRQIGGILTVRDEDGRSSWIITANPDQSA